MPLANLPQKAADGTRTHDLVLTKDALYQLSYSSATQTPGDERFLPAGTNPDAKWTWKTVSKSASAPNASRNLRSKAQQDNQLRLKLPVSSATYEKKPTKTSAERAMGIEPTWPAWKAGTLPLSYARRVIRSNYLQNCRSLCRKNECNQFLCNILGHFWRSCRRGFLRWGM